MGIFKDILAIFKKNEIAFISKNKEKDQIYTYIFNAKNVKAWKPGQHGIFFITHKKIKKSIRPFSIASTKNEDSIVISTKITDNPSEFKQALESLKPATTMTMRGPVGPLYIRENKPTLLVAGGIGITPHRAIIKDIIEEKKTKQPVVLLYIDSQNNHIYIDELKAFDSHNHVQIKLVDNRHAFINEINDFVGKYNNDGRYFLSGKKAMVKDIKKYLKKLNIKSKYIYKDVFYGY